MPGGSASATQENANVPQEAPATPRETSKSEVDGDSIESFECTVWSAVNRVS